MQRTPSPQRLGREAERALAERAAAGDRAARARLVEAHLGLVRFHARRHRRGQAPGDDLVQEGVVGLLRALDRFDPGRGVRLATYASPWIRAAMADAARREVAPAGAEPEDVAGDDGSAAFDRAARREAQAAVRTAVATLPAREAAVLALRYGLAGEALTHAAIGRRLGVSAQRVRTLEAGALARLRGSAALGAHA